jgi:cobalt-zinc-cadmium efflux system membrane fusion protein
MLSAPKASEIASGLGVVPATVLAVVAGLSLAGCSAGAGATGAQTAVVTSAPEPGSVNLSDSQLQAVKLGPAATHSFALRRSAVGSIDFDENRSVQVFSQYPGKIIQTFAEVGDEIQRGKILYSIDSPDLVQAESALIAAAGVANLTSAALARAEDLYETQGMAQKDYQQAVSDQMSAEGALKAARSAVRVFGKTEQQIAAIIAQRKIDPALAITSPVSGRVTARFAQPGLLVQPGTAPAPYSVADLATMWMLASVPESDVGLLRVGQSVTVKVMALGEHQFSARITTIGATVDPITHTAVVRSEVPDPQHRLRSGMIANFTIETGDPVESVAVPANGVVREGDGTMSVWVTTDRHKFVRRAVRTGLQQDGLDQILEGLQPGEVVVTDGAILLSNMLYGGGADS